MTITTTLPEDLDVVVDLFHQAIEYQKTKSNDYWHRVDRSLLEREVAEQRHWKIMEGSDMACFYSIAFTDPLVWDERDTDPSIYLHRIVTNPSYRGRGYVPHIVAWAEAFGRARGIRFIRLDTHRNNKRLNDYYAACGFTFAGVKQFAREGVHPLIPTHYLADGLSLFEKEI